MGWVLMSERDVRRIEVLTESCFLAGGPTRWLTPRGWKKVLSPAFINSSHAVGPTCAAMLLYFLEEHCRAVMDYSRKVALLTLWRPGARIH